MSRRSGGKDVRERKQEQASWVDDMFNQSAGSNSDTADWQAVEPGVIQNVVWAIDAFGGAVTMGSTRNGKSYYFKVYIGKPYDPVYFAGNAEGRDEMATWAMELVERAAKVL